ncbi:MAG: isocitrate/isopropylmalate family dehydrogenase [Gammaproteobacteria bacterium]|nr:isocitrate/isopropylmalate family dehydrogenase [Gammaproteobacteria bacterium]MDH3378114.1 isocitrate/isopropylmalate family dehydrogenase [Gammaproteobacteria bacterium]
MAAITVTELEGDGIGPELQKSVDTVADALPIDIAFERVDWSLETRERDVDKAIDIAEASMRKNKLALKYPTVTKTRSPNALIRRRLDFSVIYRPCISIAGIDSHFKQTVNLHIVRIATGGTYEDPGQYVGRDAAVSIRVVEREPCAQAAHFAFELARKKGLRMTSSSKHTVQKVTDGLFETVVREISADYPDVEFGNELFDALLAKIILKPQDYEVILVLNEYGDFLSDMSSGLVGSIGTGASGNYSFNRDRSVDIAMFDPAGGTAPDIAGRNLCNPTAMLLALGMLLDHIDRYDLGHALRFALLGAIRDGETTGDLGGKLGTTEFTQVVIGRLRDQLAAAK